MSQPYDEKPPTPQGQPPMPRGQQPFGAPPPVPPGPPQTGYGVPQQPVAGNPYARPVQGAQPGDFLEVALLCEQDGARVMSKDRVGNLRQNGDTLTVTWKKGASGTDTFERFQDMDPA
ncbi:hypothetical protein ACFYZ6_20810 [Streptomyces rubiginosohelvolus]|uniref:hypothetical protein n=1 Tax=Streptomyces rubiginosohelvolus TaxID=67362 RepID=UPI0036C98445